MGALKQALIRDADAGPMGRLIDDTLDRDYREPEPERPRLYELSGLYYAIGQEIDEAGGELNADLEARLAALDDTLESKADAIASLAAEADAEAAYFDAELARLKSRR